VPVPDYSDPTPARKQIAEDLREKIDMGEYAPGSKLPSNLALSKHYKVAPETIRAALAELASAGLVVAQSTRGTFVVDKPGAGARASLEAVSERVAALAEQVAGYPDLRDKVTRLEADIRYVYDWLGIDYPHGGEHEHAEETPARKRSGK
jgi:DNA-binding FadR family transcriptional regulator